MKNTRASRTKHDFISPSLKFIVENEGGAPESVRDY